MAPEALPDLGRVAAELDRLAGEIDAALDGVARRAGASAWQGPAARRFADELRLQSARLARAAAELRAVAARSSAAAAARSAGRDRLA